jgi:drug/metabolite transporter (DMT)-like permease
MPAFGTLLSMLFLGEIVRGFHLLGIALIFSGIYLTTVWRPVGRPRPG